MASFKICEEYYEGGWHGSSSGTIDTHSQVMPRVDTSWTRSVYFPSFSSSGCWALRVIGKRRLRVPWAMVCRCVRRSSNQFGFALLCRAVNSVFEGGHIQPNVKLSIGRVFASISLDQLR